MDLFDAKGNLRRGRWRCPLYEGPTDTSITVPEVKQLKPIPGAWTYFRIALEDDPEFGTVKSMYPNHTMQDYQIPVMHLRQDYGYYEDNIYANDNEPNPLPPEPSFIQPQTP